VIASPRTAVRTFAIAAAVGLLTFAAYEYCESPYSQIFGKTVVRGPSDERIVALTFDDGPNPPYTNRILSVLERERVHATFFVVGRAVEAYPQIVRREVRDGDALGNHTWDHAHLIVMDSAHVRASLQRTDAAILHATGRHTNLMRPPYGARDWIVLEDARRLGLTPVMWSVPLARDWEDPPAAVIADRILSYVGDGSIIVLHDGNRGILCGRHHLPSRVCDRSADIDATRMIVEALKSQGYRFVTIPQLLASGRATRTPSPGTE
jgi:peptidoglycan-N-acetylglucosamine deacetylase